MSNSKFFLAFLAILLPLAVRSQIAELTFGEIPREDIEMTSYPADPGADAVYLEDYGQVSMSAIDGIGIVFVLHQRIKIINSDGFDYADFNLPYGIHDKIERIQAATYNIENGEVVTSKLDKKSIYREVSGRTWNTVRFTLPDVRVGSVIEVKYTLKSNYYFSLYPWDFQHEIPVRYGGFKALIPGYFEFKVIPKGNWEKIKFNRSEESVDFGSRFVEGIKIQWAYSGIPAYREEPFSTGSEDFLTSVGFELAKITVPGLYFEEISPTYPNLSKKLLNKDDFGSVLNNSGLVSKKVRSITAGAKSETEKLRLIHKYVSENFLWNSLNDCTASAGLSKIIKTEKGNSADINLLLIDMLRQAGLKADPVIMSTRENGALDMFYAIMQKFDYLVASVRADGVLYIVDATDPLRPFNILPFECLNGDGWTVVESGLNWVKLKNNEKKAAMYSMNLRLSDSGLFAGNAQNTYIDYNAYEVRHTIKLEGKEGYTQEKKNENGNWIFTDFNWENLDSLEKPVYEKYNLTIEDAVEKYGTKMAFHPILFGTYKLNPFYSEERLTPVDFGCPQELSYTIRIILPEGYKVEEIPASIKLALPDNGGQYIYSAVFEGNNVLVQTKMVINSVRFDPENYNLLREFFTRIMQKEEELIILSKTV